MGVFIPISPGGSVAPLILHPAANNFNVGGPPGDVLTIGLLPSSVSGIQWGTGSSISDANNANILQLNAPGGAVVQLAGNNTGITGTLQLNTRPAFVAGDHYLVCDSNGNVHVSATGPAS